MYQSIEEQNEKSSDHFRKNANKRVLRNSVKYSKEFSDLYDDSDPMKDEPDLTGAFKK